MDNETYEDLLWGESFHWLVMKKMRETGMSHPDARQACLDELVELKKKRDAENKARQAEKGDEKHPVRKCTEEEMKALNARMREEYPAWECDEWVLWRKLDYNDYAWYTVLDKNGQPGEDNLVGAYEFWSYFSSQSEAEKYCMMFMGR